MSEAHTHEQPSRFRLEQTTVRCPAWVIEALDAEAAARMCSRGSLVRLALVSGLRQMEASANRSTGAPERTVRHGID
jgi:hypothetical protein